MKKIKAIKKIPMIITSLLREQGKENREIR